MKSLSISCLASLTLYFKSLAMFYCYFMYSLPLTLILSFRTLSTLTFFSSSFWCRPSPSDSSSKSSSSCVLSLFYPNKMFLADLIFSSQGFNFLILIAYSAWRSSLLLGFIRFILVAFKMASFLSLIKVLIVRIFFAIP